MMIVDVQQIGDASSAGFALLRIRLQVSPMMLKGSAKRVRRFAEEIIAEHGVRHGLLNLVNVTLGPGHSHGGCMHRHFKPLP